MRMDLILFLLSLAISASAAVPPVPWPATDGIGRSLPLEAQTGPPRSDRTVAMFYFLWLGPHAQSGGPWDVTKILTEDSEAMQKPHSPLWGPLHAPHHWGESIFGYYQTDDPYVLRRHAQMLTDAGVDTVVFDVTNQLTYRDQYRALLHAWSQVRADGGRTPQIAFLCPFWQPAKVVRELWRDLYEPGLHPDLWFQWEGKPLLLADPERLGDQSVGFDFNEQPAELKPARTLGQSFAVERAFSALSVRVPTWHSDASAVTLTLRKGGPDGEVVTTRRIDRIADNDWLRLDCPAEARAGTYVVELSDPAGRVGWWSKPEGAVLAGSALADGRVVPGARSIRLEFADPLVDRLQSFFTFRTPQPDYFRGPTGPDMWSWLEVFPQHVFHNSRGEKEQMSVGVAQNAVGGRLGSMSESGGARGRSFRNGARDTRPEVVAHGLNFGEQIQQALRADPRVLFFTGWNEWIAGRHAEFNGIREPVMFVDQFDQEFSRDIEPMKGGHGDAYYYQLAAAIRRYKGTSALPPASAGKSIEIAGSFRQWDEVAPGFADDPGDTVHRDHPGYAQHTRYLNRSGRNDIVLAKTTAKDGVRSFYVQTRAPLTPASDPGWMWLLLDVDGDAKTGWEGYDFMINRTPSADGQARLEKHTEGWSWERVGSVPIRWESGELHLAIPASMITTHVVPGRHFDFKWADHMPESGDIVAWLDAGDTAPNARFAYRVTGGW
jgi:hypothetical protein